MEHFTNILRLRRSGIRQLEIVELEERLMFSAAPLPAPAPAPDGQVVATASLEPESGSLAPLPPSPDVLSASQTTTANVLEQSTEDGVLSPTSHELVFIDTGAENYQQLLDDLWSHQDPDRHLDIVLLSSSEDGLTQITETLAQYQTEKLDAVHLVTHGADRAIKLGNTWLDSSSLNANREQISSWREALNPGADLLIYGCDLAGNALGQTLLNQLVDLTGADIAASIDSTGSALLGGNWQLEYQVGEIETHVAFSELLQSEWDSLLDAFIDTQSPTGTDAWDNAYTLSEDSTISGNVILDDTGTGLDSDTEGDALTVTAINGDIGFVGNAITLASGATLTVDANGTFTYDPGTVFNRLPGGQSEVDSFTYSIADPFGNSSTATVFLTISGVNDGPVIMAPALVNISEFDSWNFYGSSQIQISDPDDSTVEMTIAVNNGLFSLSQIFGLTFTSGDGTNDTSMTFSGSVSDINNALMYSIFSSGTSSGPSASMSIEVNDLGGGGTGTPMTATATTNITIALPSPVTSDAFLQGKYLEIGLGQDGVLGADGAAPSGFNNAGGELAVQVDRDRDGWETFDGDFILPGTPEEAWGVHVNGTTYSNSNTSPPEVTGSLTNAQSSTNGQSVEWTGSTDNLGVRQIYSVGVDDLYMDVVVELTNLGSTDFTDVYYYRNIDADNNMFHGVIDQYTTTNTIYAQGDIDGDSLVSSTQSDGSYLALMGFGSNSRVTYGGFSNRDPQSIYDGTGGLQPSGTQTNDEAISLAFHFTTIAGGETVTAHFRYYFASTDATRPVVDLDANDSGGQAGGNYATSFVEDGGPVSIVDADATVFVADLSQVAGMTISITNLLDGIQESLTVNTTGTSVVATYDSGTGVLSLSGSASRDDYSTVLQTLTYNNTSQSPDMTTRSIEVIATTAGGSSTAVTSLVAITATNDAPVVTTNSLTISEGATAVLHSSILNASDLDNTPSQLTYSVSTVSHGQFEYVAAPGFAITTFTQAEIDAGLVQFTHDGGEIPPSYKLTVSDGLQSSGLSDGVVTFLPVNEPPSVQPSTFHVLERSPVGTVVGTVQAVDQDAGDTLSYSIITGNTGGRFSIDPDTGLFQVADSNGFLQSAQPSYTIQVQAVDSQGLAQVADTVIVVDSVNTPPEALNDQYSTPQNVTLTVATANGLVANDQDVDATALAAILVQGPQHGQVTLQPNGSFIYVPDAYYSGPDSFSYQVTDGIDVSGVATVSLNVTLLAPSGGSMGPANPSSGEFSNGSSNPAPPQAGEDGHTGSDQTAVPVIIVSGPGFASTAQLSLNRIPQVSQDEQTNPASPTDGANPIEAFLGTLKDLAPTKRFQSGAKRSGAVSRERSAQLVASAVSTILPDPIHDLTAAILQNTKMWNQLNQFRNQLREQDQASDHLENLVIGSTTVVTSGLTVSYVVWLIRGGSLLATMVSVVPSWTSFDPLPVLERFAAEVQDDDIESLDSIVSGGNLASLSSDM